MLAWGDHIFFKDSLQFMSSSLELLTENLLKSGKEKFKILKSSFPNISNQQLNLLFRKGVYPYSYMSNWTRFDEQLPAIEDFENKLRGTKCSIAEYQHASDVWTAFGCRKMKDYHDIYLKLGMFSLSICTILLSAADPPSAVQI